MFKQQGEVHVIKVALLLKKVNISVRFPCSISFALKNQNSIMQHKGIYELRKGQCLINQTIETQVEVISRRGVYDQKKISLLIYMISANGKIPAGSVTINSTEKVIADKRAPLQKCPDKNAQAIYTQNFEVIQVIAKRDPPPRLTLGMLSPQMGMDILSSKIKYSSSSKNLFLSEQQDPPQNSIRSQVREVEESRLYSSKHQRSNKDLRLSQIGGTSYERKGSRGRLTRFQQLSKKSVATIERESKDSCQLKTSRVSSQYMQGQDQQLSQQKSKILRLEQDKANYIKKLAKIRDSLVRIDSQQRLQLQEEIEKAKYENDILQDQMESLKQRTKVQQRRQRQSNSAMKELKDELDKRKSRIMQLDNSRVKIQSQLGQKDKAIYQLQNEKKKLQEQLQQEKALVVSAQKRLELKENSYKQQLKKLNEKYAQSESERQKAVIDYNNILAQMQNSQKKNQLALRQKQKNSIEEKSRLTKKIQQLNSQIALNNEKLLQLKITVEEYEQFKKKANDLNIQKEYKINRLNEENQLLLNEVRYSEENYKKMAEEKERLQSILNEDKINYKKKYNETLSELNILKDKLQKNMKLNANVEGRMVQLESQIEMQIKEKNNLTLKLQEYKRQVNKFIAEQENREKMAETLSVQNISQNQKLSQYKSKLEAERKKFEQMQDQYEQQVQYLVKSKEMLQSQLEETRWMLQKEIQKFEVMSAKNKELNQEVIELNHKVIMLQEKQSSFSQQIQSIRQFAKQLENQVQNLNQRLKISTEKLRDKQQQVNSLQKKLENLKEQNYLLTQILQKSNRNLEQKSQMLQRAQQLGSNRLKEKQNEINLLNEQIYKFQQMLNRQKQQTSAKNSELQILKESYKVINSDYSALISKSDNIRQEQKRKNQRIQQLQTLLNDQKSSKLIVSRQLQRKAIELQEYRSNVIKSLQQFFNILNRQESQGKRESTMLITLPEENLSLLQIQALKKRTALILKHQQELYQLSNKIKTLQNQQKRQQKYISDLEQHHETVLKKQQERYRLLSEQNVRQLSEFSQKMQNLTKNEDQRSTQIEYFNSQSKKYEALIEELNQILSRLRAQNGQLKVAIVQLQNEAFSYKQKQIKDKLLSNTETEQLKHILKFQQQRYRDTIQNHKEQLRTKDKVISDKMDELKKWISRQQEWKMEIRKYSQKIKELQTKIQTQNILKANIQKSIRQKQSKIRALQQDISSLKYKIQQFKIRQLTLQQQSKKQKAEIQLLQAKFKANIDELLSKSHQAIENERRQKEKREKIQSYKTKIQQQNKQIRQKCVKLQSQIEFYKFYKLESTKKIQQHQKYRNETMTELIKYRENSLKSQKVIGNFQNKYYKMEVEMQSIIKQKSILRQDNSRLKQKIKQQEQKLIENQSKISQLDSRDKQIVRLNNIINSNEEQYEKMAADLKASLAKSKQALNEKITKIKELQKFVQEKYNDVTDERLKWQKQSQGEKNLLHHRIVQLEDKYQMIQEEFEFQKLQAIRQIQSANGIIQQLNEVIRDKEETIQHKDQIINQQIVRLQELNIQLNECVNKWQTQKESYLPTETKMAEIYEELNRMNKFISDLDGRNKQLLEINKRKMQQNIVSKPSITEQLKEVYVLLQKNKNRILNRCQTEKEKQTVISEFKSVMDKLDLTLKSTQIIVAKQ